MCKRKKFAKIYSFVRNTFDSRFNICKFYGNYMNNTLPKIKKNIFLLFSFHLFVYAEINLIPKIVLRLYLIYYCFVYFTK